MNKKNVAIILSGIVCIIVLIISIITIIKSKDKSVTFQSKNEMVEVLNGTWRTGDSEFDFILTIGGGLVDISMDGKNEDNADNLVCVPDMGYFYFESAGDNKEDRYYVVKDNGKYLIEHSNWMFEKVE